MSTKLRHVGFDVHAETIAAAVADAREVRALGVIPNQPEFISKLMRQLGPAKRVRLLRGRADGVRALLAAHVDEDPLRRGGARARCRSRPVTG